MSEAREEAIRVVLAEHAAQAEALRGAPARPPPRRAAAEPAGAPPAWRLRRRRRPAGRPPGRLPGGRLAAPLPAPPVARGRGRTRVSGSERRENIPARPASDWSIVRIYPRVLRPTGPSIWVSGSRTCALFQPRGYHPCDFVAELSDPLY
eukprot:974191-Prorocentrum_minimum.AAC.3